MHKADRWGGGGGRGREREKWKCRSLHKADRWGEGGGERERENKLLEKEDKHIGKIYSLKWRWLLRKRK